MSFYELQAPTEWADPPSMWSCTSLDAIEACPRRWQLLRSRWGDLARFPSRTHPAAIEGHIVHAALDRLARACGQRGNPRIGSAEFAAAMAEANFLPGITQAIADAKERLIAHPRPGPPFTLRVSADELANRATRMFREQYRPGFFEVGDASSFEAPSRLKASPAFNRSPMGSEVSLSHPNLPFYGVIDRVQPLAGGVEIVDFKTGRPRDTHRLQLMRYAVLWYRNVGEIPIRVCAQYLEESREWPVVSAELESIEKELSESIARLYSALSERPATARVGPDCKACEARARCAEGWAASLASGTPAGRGDAELVAQARSGQYGFVAQSSSGARIAVVYQPAVFALLPVIAEGQVVRVLDGVWQAEGTELEVRPWTEVYVVNAAQSTRLADAKV